MWKGENYLLSMQTDTNFIAIGAIGQKFGFDLHGNPLMIKPRSQEEMSQPPNFDFQTVESTEKGIRFFSPPIPKVPVSPRFPKPRHRRQWDEECPAHLVRPSPTRRPPSMGSIRQPSSPVFSSRSVGKARMGTIRVDHSCKPPAVFYKDKRYSVKWVGRPSGGSGPVTLVNVSDEVRGIVRLSDNTCFENPVERTNMRGS